MIPKNFQGKLFNTGPFVERAKILLGLHNCFQNSIIRVRLLKRMLLMVEVNEK